MSAITVEEFVNKISYRIDTESLKQVIRTTDRLYAHLGRALSGVSGKMDASWRSAMANMAKASRESARSISADAQKASGAWRTGQSGAQSGKGGGMGLLGMAGRLGAGYAAYSVGRYAIQSASDLERMTAQFEVMLGGADKAKTMVESIQKLAASTPLTSMGVTDSVKTILQFGVAGDKVISTVRMLGDVAGGDQERLNRLAYAYGQTMTAGKLMGQDLLQYINVGFNPLKIMAENLDKFGLKAGTTQSDLRDAMSKGKISADMVTKAFTMATSAGGMFFQNMEKQSQTLGGLYSTLVDNIQLSLVKAMQPVIPLLKSFIDWIGKIDWQPVVLGIMMVVEGLKLFGRTLETAGIFESLELIKIAIMDMFGDGGVTEWATVIRAAANMVADAFWIIARAIATVSGWIQFLKNNLILLAPFALSIGSKLAFSMLAALGPIGAVVAALGVVYYAYQRINDAREQGARDEKYHAAMVEEAGATRSHAVLSAEKTKYAHYAATGRWTGSPTEAIPTRAAAAEIANRLGASVNEAKAKRDAAGARMAEATSTYNAGQSAADPFSALLQQQLNNSKKVSITQNNTIEMPVTVDSKGETPLTPGAVKSIVDTAIRSGINVRLLGVLAEGV